MNLKHGFDIYIKWDTTSFAHSICDMVYMIYLRAPFLRRMIEYSMGYKYTTPNPTITTTYYVDDLVILIDNINNIQPQLNKLLEEWAHMTSGYPNV